MPSNGDGVLLLSTRVDLSGANELAAGVTLAIQKVQAQTATSTAAMASSWGTYLPSVEAVKTGLDGVKKKTKEVETQTEFSMREARGSLMLMEHELGVRLPREMNTLIARIPGIGVAMEGLLPIMGAVFAGKMIYDFIEKNKEAQDALSAGWATSFESITTHSDELRVSIAASALKIDQLLGKPTSGDALTLEIAKATVEAEKLSASLTKDLEGLIKLMAAASHGSIMTTLMGTSGAGQAEDVAKGLKDAIAKIPHDSNFTENMQKAITDSWQRAQSEIKTNKAALVEQQATNEALGEGRAGVTDFTAANTALQEFQDHLSASYRELDLLREDDAGKKKAKDIGEAVSAEDAAFNAEVQHNKEMAEWHKRRVHDQQDIAAAVLKARDAAESEAEEILKMDALVAESVQKTGEKAVESLRRQQEAAQRLIESEGKLQESKDKAAVTAIKSDAASGVIPKLKEQELLRDAYQKELDDLNASNAKKIAADIEYRDKMRAIQTTGGLTGDALAKATDAADAAQKQLNDDLARQATEQASLTAAIKATETEAAKLQSAWSTYFRTMTENLPSMGAQIRLELQDTTTKFVDGFSQGVAKCIVAGKSFGQMMQQLGAQIIEQLIQMTVKWLILEAVQKLFGQGSGSGQAKAAIGQNVALAESEAGVAASAAFAGTMVTTLGDIAAAGAAAAEAYAVALSMVGLASAAGGWDVPSGGPHPAMLHSREMVLPEPLAQGVRSMTERGGGSESTSTSTQHIFNMHFVYSPQGSGTPKEHGEEAFEFIRSKFLRMGYHI